MEAQGYRIRQSANSGPTWKKIVVESNVPEQLNPLRELSRNLWWAWSDEARALFSEIDPVIWEECEHNPIVLLEETSLERFEELKSDQSFILRMKSTEIQLNKYLEERKVLLGPKIAYFSMEFGLHSSLKIYSGGLGVLAGDFLKEASDSKVDMTGVGLLYRYGYFKQIISSQGEQIAQYDAEHFSKIPIQPVMDENNSWITIAIEQTRRFDIQRPTLCRAAFDRLHYFTRINTRFLCEDEQFAHCHHLRSDHDLVCGFGNLTRASIADMSYSFTHCHENGHHFF